MFNHNDNDKAVEFANEFLNRYTAVGFGALSKREVDLMLLQMLQDHLPNFKTKSDFDAAILLKTTKRKIRGLRNEISFREGHSHSDEDLNTSLRQILLKAEILPDDNNMVMIQIDDAVLKGYAEKIVRSEFGIVDSSFNSAILKLSGEKFLLLTYSTLSSAEKIEAEKTISEICVKTGGKPDSQKSAFIQFKDGFVFGAGSRTGQLCVSGALALLTNGGSLILDGIEPVMDAGRSIGDALKTAREFFIKNPSVS